MQVRYSTRPRLRTLGFEQLPNSCTHRKCSFMLLKSLQVILLTLVASPTPANFVSGTPAVSLGSQPSVSLNKMYELVRELQTASGARFPVQIQINSYAAQGFASITGHPSRGAIISVDPGLAMAGSDNVLAFILGHELAHVVRLHGPPALPQNEWEADRLGADWAVLAGYDKAQYVNWMLSLPNGCSPSHGCLHKRAEMIDGQPHPANHPPIAPRANWPVPNNSQGAGCSRPSRACQCDPMCSLDELALPDDAELAPCAHFDQITVRRACSHNVYPPGPVDCRHLVYCLHQHPVGFPCAPPQPMHPPHWVHMTAHAFDEYMVVRPRHSYGHLENGEAALPVVGNHAAHTCLKHLNGPLWGK